MNKEIEVNLTCKYVKKESKTFKDNTYYYVFVNFTDKEGLTNPLKIKVDEVIYNKEYKKGDTLNLSVRVRADYLSLVAIGENIK